MTFQIRQLSTADYPLVISVIDQWWDGRQMADQRMGFQLEPGDTQVDGIPFSSGYDGQGGDRVRFIRSLRGA